MTTLLYAPGARVLISTAREGIIDVTDDLSGGGVQLRKNQSHAAQFSLVNHRRKYDGVFTPNDRFVVRLKRLSWLQVMAGYLTQVPFFTNYPRSVTLTGECTLKRLRFHLWDPGSFDSVNLLNSLTVTSELQGHELDDSFTAKARAVLTEIAQWKQGIHIGRIPDGWLERVDTLARELGPTFSVASDLIGSSAVIDGQSVTEEFGTQGLKTLSGAVDVGPGYGSLPYLSGKVMDWHTTGRTFFTGEDRAAPVDPWYCAIRTPIQQLSTSLPADMLAIAKAWWGNRHLLLVNQKTNAAVVVRLADDGPDDRSSASESAYQVGLPVEVMNRLGLHQGDSVFIRFAKPELVPGADLVTTGSVGETPTRQAADSPDMPAKGSKDNMKVNVQSAFDFISQNWPHVAAIGGYRQGSTVAGTNTLDDHSRGLALDVVPEAIGTAATGDRLALGNSIAAWFAANPNAFGTHYIIWQNRILSAERRDEGWRPYTVNGREYPESAVTLRHMDHVHISFYDTGTSQMGAMGGAWRGSSPGDFQGGFSTGPSGTVASPITANQWFSQYDYESTILFGIRALMNDVPILPFVEKVMTASMRHFCSAPNGDFIGWFPDYFGVYGTAGRMIVENIELQDFSMVWNDEHLKTHIFASGSMTGFGSPAASAEVAVLKSMTHGVASVEFPAILKALLNADENNPEAAGWLTPKAILDRFGARYEYQGMDVLTSPKAEFWYALQRFQENWASQFSAQVPITFMPELFPGMLLVLPAYGIQFYIDGVDHNWDFSGEGFSTTAYVSAPSATDGRGLFGLPKGGRL